MSTSDSKSQNTTFTTAGSQASTHSEIECTQSPTRCEAAAMDRDLRGIGYRTEPSPGHNLNITLPSRPLQHQSSSNHSTADPNSVEVSSDVLNTQTAANFDGYESRMACDSEFACGVRTPKETTINSCNENLEAIGDLFADVPNPVVYTFDESSSSSGNSDDDDIDIEKFARDALSQWFGLSIDRFERPIRVIHAFEQVKEQVAAIIEDEGHTLINDQDEDQYEQGDDDDQDVLDADAEPCDAGDSSQIPPNGGSESGAGKKDRKRLSNGDLKSEPLQNPETKMSGHKKKCRVELNLSCPYRKRNPLRFNVSRYEKCANRFYPNMSVLKKHLCSEHYKPIQYWRRCGRCQQPFENSDQAWVHSRQCPHPPQPINNSRPSDPEDGFNEMIHSQLKSRKPEFKIEEWDTLYRLLFPGAVVPEPGFEPVVEDYEVADRFKCSKTALYEEIDRIATQNTSDQVARGRLSNDIQKLVESQIANLLARQNLSPHAIHTPQINHGYNIDSFPPLGDGYVGVTTGRLGFGEDLDSFSEVIQVPGHSPRNGAHDSSQAGAISQIILPLDVPQVNHTHPTYLSRQSEVLPAMNEQRNYYQLSRPPLQSMPLATELEGPIRPVARTNIQSQGSQISSGALSMYSQTEPLSHNHPMSTWSSAGAQNDSWDPTNQFAVTGSAWNDENNLYGSDEWVNPIYEFDSFVGNGQGTL